MYHMCPRTGCKFNEGAKTCQNKWSNNSSNLNFTSESENRLTFSFGAFMNSWDWPLSFLKGEGSLFVPATEIASAGSANKYQVPKEALLNIIRQNSNIKWKRKSFRETRKGKKSNYQKLWKRYWRKKVEIRCNCYVELPMCIWEAVTKTRRYITVRVGRDFKKS